MVSLYTCVRELLGVAVVIYLLATLGNRTQSGQRRYSKRSLDIDNDYLAINKLGHEQGGDE